jgi:hypothetical protein
MKVAGKFIAWRALTLHTVPLGTVVDSPPFKPITGRDTFIESLREKGQEPRNDGPDRIGLDPPPREGSAPRITFSAIPALSALDQDRGSRSTALMSETICWTSASFSLPYKSSNLPEGFTR